MKQELTTEEFSELVNNHIRITMRHEKELDDLRETLKILVGWLKK